MPKRKPTNYGGRPFSAFTLPQNRFRNNPANGKMLIRTFMRDLKEMKDNYDLLIDDESGAGSAAITLTVMQRAVNLVSTLDETDGGALRMFDFTAIKKFTNHADFVAQYLDNLKYDMR